MPFKLCGSSLKKSGSGPDRRSVPSMILTPSEVVSLTRSLSRWELAEYISSGLVTLACLGEFVAEFTDWFTGDVKDKKGRLAKGSTLLLIASLSFELVCLVRTNQLSGKVIGSLDEKAETASKKSELAILNGDSALTKAGTAQTEVDTTKSELSKAKIVAIQAQALARGARQEADSFEKDIKSAKEQAAGAESHLAEALQRAAEATAQLERLKSPRSLTDIPKLISTLAEFKDTEYTFSSVFPEEESILLLRSIDDVLQRAGWKRGKSVPGFPGVNVFGSDNPYGVPSALTNGIRISVDWPEGLSPLESLPVDKLPMPVSAAVFLYRSVLSHISPAEEHPYLVDVQKGQSKTIRISVGKKP